MSATRVSYRPEQRILIRDLGELRQQLADLNPRHVRVDRLIRPAKIRRGQRLAIERFEMTRAASQPDEDDRGPLRLRGTGSQSQQLAEAEAGKPRQSDS